MQILVHFFACLGVTLSGARKGYTCLVFADLFPLNSIKFLIFQRVSLHSIFFDLFLRPMKRKRYIGWFLIMVSLIMLTASVIPHHHHREILCLQHDVEDCSSNTTRSQNENKECQACCVTKAFCFVQQQNTNILPVDYFPPVTLFTLSDILNLLPPEEEIHIHSFVYKESLHGVRLITGVGLRAPPAPLFA